MKRSVLVLITLLMICSANKAWTQLDTIHYIPPMHANPTSGGIIIIGGGGGGGGGVGGGGFGGSGSLVKEHYIYLSTPSTTPFTVTIKKGDGTVLDTPSIVNGSPYTYYIGTGDNTPCFVKKNQLNNVLGSKGIICSAAEPFYMSYRVNGGNGATVQHSDWATGKGSNGLGTSFRVGGLPCFNATTNSGHPRSITVGVMATQNNTTVTFSDYDPAIKLFGQTPYVPPATFSVLLNAGETYTINLQHLNTLPANFVGLLGSLITSDKPIAVINGNLTGQQHPTNDANQDFGFDLSIPTDKIGQEYILVEGLGSPDMETPMVIADQNNTDIFVNGGSTPIATINAGDFYVINNSYYQGTNHKNMYVHTSKPAYMYQMMAASQSGDNDGGMVLVPAISCFLPSVIDEIPLIDEIGNVSYNTGITITTLVGSTVLLNNNPLTGPELVLGTPWETYKIDSNLVGNMTIVSSSAIAVSAVGVDSPSGFAGYYSGFVNDPDSSDFDVVDFCSTYNTTFQSYTDPDFVPDSITWNFGELSAGLNNFAVGDTVTHAYAAGGTFTIQMIVHRCKNDTVTKTITINPTFFDTTTVMICSNGSYTLPSGMAVNTTGVYVDSFLTVLGCDSIITTDLTMAPINITNNNIYLCYGGTYTLPSGLAANSSGYFSDTLVSNMGCDSIINTDLVIEQLLTSSIAAEICDGETYMMPAGYSVTTTGIYVDTLTAALGCDSIVTTDLLVKPLPSINAGPDLDACPGDNLILLASNPNGANITWNNGINDGIEFTIVAGQTYTVIAELNGCYSQDEMTIDVLSIPDAEFTYSQEEPEVNGTFVQFYIQEGYNADWTYFWNFGDGANSDEYGPNHTFADGDIETYEVDLLVTNQLGCSDSASVKIKLIKPIIYYVPNAFTPDGDNLNNIFLPVFVSGFDPYDYHLMILNRWGEVMFESYNALEGWDGTYGDQLVEDGVYVWAIEFGELNTDKMHTEQGHITVLR